MPPLLEVRNLKVQFKTQDGVVNAVNDTSFHLERGETLGIVGESGSGKSVSALSLLGLLRHMAEVERKWFRQRFAGQDVPNRYQSELEPDGDFDGAVADQAVVDEAWAAWREEVAFAEQFVQEKDLNLVGRDGAGEPISLRELLVHMIEEYARHNGHADLLRERIDGRVGQ